MPRRSSARRRLVDAALDRMRARGYPSTTVDEICDAAGLSKGSFYHHFDTKQDLALAAVDACHEEIVARMNGSYAGVEEPRERAFGFLEHVESIWDELWARGSLLGGLASEVAETDPALRERIGDKFEDLGRRIAPLFAAIGGRPGTPDAEELAWTFLAMLEGSIVLARARDDASEIPAGIRAFRRHLEFLVDNTDRSV